MENKVTVSLCAPPTKWSLALFFPVITSIKKQREKILQIEGQSDIQPKRLANIVIFFNKCAYTECFKMPSFCSVLYCGMRWERDRVSFFRFPAVVTNKKGKTRELSSERRNKSFSERFLKNARVCSRHFIDFQQH